MLSPEAIQKKEFEQSVLGGYRRDEVDDFLDQVEADYRKLYNENTELVDKLKTCLAKIEEYKKDEEYLKIAIINAQKLNETALRELELKEKEVEITCKEKAAAIVAEAEEQAKALLEKAERESADALKTAREECKAEIEAEQKKSAEEIRKIQKETKAEQAKLDYLHTQVSEFKNTIIELYKAHLTSISKLPEFKVEEEAPAAEEAVPAAEEPAAAPAPVARETAPVEEPVAEEKKEEKKSDTTVEFKIDSKPEKEEKEAPMEARQLKFENLKFGIDYDINKDE